MEAETLLISAVVRTGDYASAAQRGITRDHFTSHRDVWEWLEDYVVEHQKAPGKIALKYKFPDFRVVAIDDVTWAADELWEAHDRTSVIRLMKEVGERLKGGSTELAKSAISSYAMSSEANRGTATYELSEAPQRYWQEVAARVDRAEDGGTAGISTGFATIDDYTGGLQPGDLWVPAARLGVGKTWIMIRMAVQAMLDGYTVQFNSIEQGEMQIAFRVHTMLANKLGFKLTNSSMSSGKGIDLMHYRDFLEQLPEKVEGKLFITDSTSGPIGPMTVASQIELIKPDVVFIDYLTLMKTNGDGDWLDISSLTKSVKLVAQQYQVPIVAAAQINRDGENVGRRPPGTKNLARSDSIGQDADAVLTMSKYTTAARHLFMAKYRHGRDGYSVYAEFDPNVGVFEEVSHDDAVAIAAKADLDHDE